MFSFKKCLTAFAGVSLFFCALATPLPLTSRAQSNNPTVASQLGQRMFYLTKGGYEGNQALTACAEGYHMASIWEVVDPSNLQYDTALGFTVGDSGSGPPNAQGWIRTGRGASTFYSPGANCDAWTSADPLHYGTAVYLSFNSQNRGWVSSTLNCDFNFRVWCVQD